MLALGGSVGWLSTGDCMTSGDVGLTLDVSKISELFGPYQFLAECRLGNHRCQ